MPSTRQSHAAPGSGVLWRGSPRRTGCTARAVGKAWPRAGGAGEGAAGASAKYRLFFLLCCRCCQALLPILFLLCILWALGYIAPIVWRLPMALGPRVSTDLLSVRVQPPVTRFSLRLSTTPWKACRRRPHLSDGFFEGPGSSTGRLRQQPPPPAPRTKPHSAPQYRLRRFERCPLW